MRLGDVFLMGFLSITNCQREIQGWTWLVQIFYQNQSMGSGWNFNIQWQPFLQRSGLFSFPKYGEEKNTTSVKRKFCTQLIWEWQLSLMRGIEENCLKFIQVLIICMPSKHKHVYWGWEVGQCFEKVWKMDNSHCARWRNGHPITYCAIMWHWHFCQICALTLKKCRHQ